MTCAVDWTAVGTVATALGVVVAAVAVAFEGRRSKFTTGVDLFMRLRDEFNTQRLEQTRAQAAKQLLSGGTGRLETGRELTNVLNFFENVGFLYRRKALDLNAIFHLFGPWIIGCGTAAGPVMAALRGKGRAALADLDAMLKALKKEAESERHSQLLGIDQSSDAIEAFLQAEAAQAAPSAAPEPPTSVSSQVPATLPAGAA
jgi:hypothetical protein